MSSFEFYSAVFAARELDK